MPPSSELEKAKRFRFSLRSLLIFTAVLSVSLVAGRHYWLTNIEPRREMLRFLAISPGTPPTEVRSLLGRPTRIDHQEPPSGLSTESWIYPPRYGRKQEVRVAFGADGLVATVLDENGERYPRK